MSSFPRYAIYYTAAAGSHLTSFGERLLGYDAFNGNELPFPDGIVQAIPDWRAFTRDPRKYGFHATLKAPLSLATGRTETELVAACESFAAMARPIPIIRPIINAISGFIAMVPSEASTELEQLAADCVREFDLFRAPLTQEDRARRNPTALTPRQRDHLDRWGYPYVMEDFRFHMTLTGKLPADRSETILPILRERFAALKITMLSIDSIALSRQDSAESQFRVIDQYALRGL